MARFTSIILSFLFLLFSLSCSYKTPNDEFVYIPGGYVDIGSERGLSSEKPVRRLFVKSFFLSKNLVTVEQFSQFIQETSYKTDAEKFGNAAVFEFDQPGWILVNGANWQFPQGPNKNKAAGNHPVTQVSWNDAKAFASWKKARLPEENEWEHAARNAINSRTKYPWGEHITFEGKYLANIWQGQFPIELVNEDGYELTSPVMHFPPTPLGLFDMTGNVWEWTDSFFNINKETKNSVSNLRTVRGGSFLCDPDWCHGFRVSSRMGTSPETSLMHTGFRIAKDT